VLAFPDVSQVIYARVPDTLKEATDLYASDQGVTLTGAVVDLLERGLAAVTDERSIAELERQVATVATEKTQIEADLKVATNELNALRTFAQRATGTQVGRCPKCEHEISGYELLGTSQCGNCGQSLVNLLAPPDQGTSIDQREFGLLVGALGAALVGVVLFGGKGTAGG
jgi:hypothetical protein